ncbi:hypothetical protein Tco_0364695 [Tanacetum coccineum]
MDRSFTLGSTEEVDNVKILQSCNGLLLYGGSGLPLSGKVVQYNLISKTLHEIYDCGSNQVDDNHDDNDDDDELLQQFQLKHKFMVHTSLSDPRLKSKKSAIARSFTLGSTEEADNVKILQSCNGLLLCGGSGLPIFITAGLRITFDPTKSPHYKLVDARRTFCDIDIQIYSSETGKWSLCSDRFNYFSFDHFDSAIYWNDGLHWLETENRQLMHYSLNIKDPDHPIITTIPIPQRGMTFLKSYGYMDPIQILIQMSHLLHLEGKLFEWRGSLFLVCLDDFGSREFTIYEMTIGCSVWMVRYRVYTYNFMTLLPEVDDNHDDNDDADDDELLQQFQAEHNVYEFIPSFASETDIQEKDEKSSKNDKTEHEMEEREKDSQIKVKVNPDKVKGSKPKP